jgi:hypothetical protein
LESDEGSVPWEGFTAFLPKYDAARAHPDGGWQVAARRPEAPQSSFSQQSVISLAANGRPHWAQIVVDLVVLPETYPSRLRFLAIAC